jgi:hypothetical protein
MGHDLPEELWEQVVTKIKLLSGEA